MGLNIGSAANAAANIASRKSDSGKSGESSLYEFLHQISNAGVQVKSNFEVEFLQIPDFQFYCQSVSIPGLRSNVGELHYKGRSIQIPINMEQDHEFQFTVLNDGSGRIYTKVRQLMAYDLAASQRMPYNGYIVMVKARGDGMNTGGMDTVLRGVRITQVSGLDYSHTDSTLQTFTVNGYADYVEFRTSSVKRKDGLLGKVDKLSSKVSGVLGR